MDMPAGPQFSSGDWIFPIETRKSGKVCVATVHFRLFLNGQSGNVSLGSHVSRRSQLFQKMEEDDGKVLSWFEDNDGGLVYPALHTIRCLGDGHGVFQDAGVGHETNETAHHDPGNPDGFSVIDFNPFLEIVVVDVVLGEHEDVA